MSLDVWLEKSVRPEQVFEWNITHNLNRMAEAAGIYQCLWRPEEYGAETGSDLIQPLKDGLKRMLAEPEKFKALNPENGWGDYEGLVEFVIQYLSACISNPTATIRVSR